MNADLIGSGRGLQVDGANMALRHLPVHDLAAHEAGLEGSAAQRVHDLEALALAVQGLPQLDRAAVEVQLVQPLDLLPIEPAAPASAEV
jgi:hypothetical protein